MIQLTDTETAAVLGRVRELASAAPIFDMHVHASEIFAGSNEYGKEDPPGVYSVAGRAYNEPLTGRLTLDTGEPQRSVNAAAKARVSEMMFTRAYEHVGPSVLLDHMDICGIADALLLPVVGRAEEIDVQMARLVQHSSATQRLHIAYCVPGSVSVTEIDAHLRQAVGQYPLAAVKVHPNVSQIDLGAEAGRERLEAILHTCGALALPVVIHGGRSPMFFNEPAREFAILDNLARVDWSASASTVVISHFGSYGFDHDELPGERAKLQTLLDRYSNLMTDTSGLPYHTLKAMLPDVDSDRILFGSDSLYVLMWQSVITLMCALDDAVQSRADEYFTRITNRNVRNVFGNAS